MQTPDSVMKMLVDETRLRCVLLLAAEGELCVCELGTALLWPQPKISHHLGILRKSRMVMDRKAGQWVYYRLHPELPAWVTGIIGALAEGAQDSVVFQEDRRRLTAMGDRPGRCAAASSEGKEAITNCC